MSRAKKDEEKRTSLTEDRLKTFETFRINLRLLRHSKDMSALALGKDIGFEKAYRIIDLEEGKATAPKLEEVMMIAKYFDITIDKLLFYKAEIKF